MLHSSQTTLPATRVVSLLLGKAVSQDPMQITRVVSLLLLGKAVSQDPMQITLAVNLLLLDRMVSRAPAGNTMAAEADSAWARLRLPERCGHRVVSICLPMTSSS